MCYFILFYSLSVSLSLVCALPADAVATAVAVECVHVCLCTQIELYEMFVCGVSNKNCGELIARCLCSYDNFMHKLIRFHSFLSLAVSLTLELFTYSQPMRRTRTKA